MNSLGELSDDTEVDEVFGGADSISFDRLLSFFLTSTEETLLPPPTAMTATIASQHTVQDFVPLNLPGSIESGPKAAQSKRRPQILSLAGERTPEYAKKMRDRKKAYLGVEESAACGQNKLADK